MKTEFKDLAHLYFPFQFTWVSEAVPFNIGDKGIMSAEDWRYWDEHKKPILRPLSDMSEEELIELLTNVYESIYGIAHEPFKDVILHAEGNDKVGLVCKCYMGQRIGFSIEVERGVDISSDGLLLMVNQFDCTKWLLSKHFDLFGLIESGEAIDKTEL